MTIINHDNDWKLNQKILDMSITEIMKNITLDRTYDNPYIGGYSKDGKTFYLDKDMPTGYTYKGKKVKTDKYLMLHETVEKSLMDMINLHYIHAHQIALRAELEAVKVDGITLKVYNRFMDKWIKLLAKKPLTRVAKDLDLRAYQQEEDFDLLKRMKQVTVK